MLSKMRKTNNKGFTLIELMIVIAIIGILAAIAIPNFIAYRNKTFCSKAESDANNIAADIADYFAIPTHIDISTDDVNYNPGANTFTVLATNPNTVITVTVTDVSNRCPEDYISASQGSANPKGDGWAPYTSAGPNIYTKTIRQAAVN